MNKEEESEIRAQLANHRDQILEEIKVHGGSLEPGTMSELRDPEDQAAAVANLWVDDQINRDDRLLLEKIDLALQRLDEGTYHICADCGGEIPAARLLAKPSTSLCVPCQEKKEAGRSPGGQ